jgi:hypothetical protein
MVSIRPLLFAAALLAPIAAKADCARDVAEAYSRANTLPASNGRAALLEQIQRAEIAHHEGDENECLSAVADAKEVLDEVHAAPATSTSN